MRIPQDIIEHLQELKIESVAEKLGIYVKRHKAICFMHDDHNPSLKFNPSKNMFFCFVCDKGGGPIQLVMEHEGWSFQAACLWLAKEFNIVIPNNNGYISRRVSRSKPELIKNKPVEAYREIDSEIGEWLLAHTGLSVEASNFLFQIRKYEPAVIEQLRIASISDPKAITARLERIFGYERCKKSGFFWDNEKLSLIYDSPCLLFPFYTTDGRLYSIQSRYIGTNSKISRFRFPKNVKQGIFNAPILNSTSVSDRLYISEGITDCIAFLSAGKKAVAFPGAGIHHSEDVLLLINKNLYMYPDNDDAGERLYVKLNEILKPYASSVRRLTLKEGCKDYSDMYIQLLKEHDKKD